MYINLLGVVFRMTRKGYKYTTANNSYGYLREEKVNTYATVPLSRNP